MADLMQSTETGLFRDLTHYHIVDEVWHWSSVDWGRRCVFDVRVLCIRICLLMAIQSYA